MNKSIWCLALVLSGAALVAVGAAAAEADAAQPLSVGGPLAPASSIQTPAPGADLARPSVTVERVLSSAAGMSLLALPVVEMQSAKAAPRLPKGCGDSNGGCFCLVVETGGCDVQTACGNGEGCRY